jgi:hypothetical protein
MSITALYRGNSSPGQLADSSGNGNTLTLVGTVPNLSSPTPPEGDRWLAIYPQGPVGDDLEGPIGVINPAQGMVGFKFMKDAVVTFPEIWLSFYKLVGALNGIHCIYQASGDLEILVFDNSAGVASFVTPIAANGATHAGRIEWGAFGTRAYVDGVLIGSHAFLPDFTNAQPWIGGDPLSGANSMRSGGVDFVQYADDPNEAYSGDVSPAALLDKRRRR